MRPVPISESESIFERFWDPMRSRLSEWEFSCDQGTGGALRQQWHACGFAWERGGGAVAARIVRDLRIETTGYDRLLVCASLPDTARVTLRAVVDGRAVTPIDGAPGRSTYVEYEGPIEGTRIERLEIELTDEGAVPGVAHINWIGLADSVRRKGAAARPSAFEDGWDDLVLPAGRSVEARPTLGLMFGEEELDGLRRKAASPLYAPLVDALRTRAHEQLALAPWCGIGEFPNQGVRSGRWDGPHHLDPMAMRLGAFVGLIDRDERLMRMALDHALAAAHCGRWCQDFSAVVPGTTWDHRAFVPYRIATNVVYAWDWAGAYLTDAGRAVLAQAVALKGLPWMLMTLMRYGYVRGCNQGAYFSYGAIICELALGKAWQHGGELLEVAVAALDETMDTYLGEDGGAFEGVGYVSSTLGHALIAYQALARHRGVELRSIVPPKVLRSVDYLTAMLSTAPPVGSSINVADGGRPGSTLYPECLAGLCELTGDPAIRALMAAMVAPAAGARDTAGTPGSVFNVIFGPDELPEPAARPPVFRLLPDTGMLCSCRPTPDGPVRLQLIGAPARAGHGHEDKGSFVLEAFGEEIAIDRGQMGYDDPRCTTIGYARYHNVVGPATAEDEPARQVNPCPSAVIPQGEGDERTLRCRVDASGTYGDLVHGWTREIDSDEPTRFVVTDTVALAQAGSVCFSLHSRFPWEKAPAGWVTRGTRAELTVAPQWQPAAGSGEEDFVDGSKAPAYRLLLRTACAASHTLRTELIVRPA